MVCFWAISVSFHAKRGRQLLKNTIIRYSPFRDIFSTFVKKRHTLGLGVFT